MQGRKNNKNNMITAFFVLLSSGIALVPANDVKAQGLGVSTVLENMNAEQMNAYLTGIIEGLAFARFENEGQNAEGGMKCIHDWFYDDEQSVSHIIEAFNRFQDYHAVAVVAALAAQKCGD